MFYIWINIPSKKAADSGSSSDAGDRGKQFVTGLAVDITEGSYSYGFDPTALCISTAICRLMENTDLGFICTVFS